MKELTPKGAKVRLKVLEAAVHCLATRGPDGTSVTEIAKKAKISRSLVPYYLGPTAETLPTVIQHIAERGYAFFEAQGRDDGEAFPATLAIARERWGARLPPGLERVLLNAVFFENRAHYYRCFMLLYFQATFDARARAMLARIVEQGEEAFSRELGDRGRASLVYRWMTATIQYRLSLRAPGESREAFIRRLAEEFGALIGGGDGA